MRLVVSNTLPIWRIFNLRLSIGQNLHDLQNITCFVLQTVETVEKMINL